MIVRARLASRLNAGGRMLAAVACACVIGLAAAPHARAGDLDRAYAALRGGTAKLDDVRAIGLGAAQGDPVAAEVLGWLFATGTVIRQDPVRAVGWYVRAASRGAPNALENARIVMARLNPAERARLDPTWTRYVQSASVQATAPVIRRFGRNAGPGPRASTIPADRLAVVQMVEAATAGTNVTPSLAKAVAKVESNFRADAVSSAGARGVMQIMPSTAAGEFGAHPDTLWDARYNAVLGVRYLDSLITRYGAVDIALSHYNGGSSVGPPGNARVTPWTRDYVDAVLAWERVFAGRAPGEPSPLPMSQVSPEKTPTAGPIVHNVRPAQSRPRVRIIRPSY
jgi:soluble lytic murein transglycosylase-like protein